MLLKRDYLNWRIGLSGLLSLVSLCTTAWAGQLKVLHSFTGGPDGGFPYGVLLQDSTGKLYGTTYGGGDSNFGTIFSADAAGHQTVLHNFAGPPDGAYPYAGLVRDKKGNLYGTTYEGGDLSCDPPYAGCGTVFRLGVNGQLTVLHSFTGYPEGAFPLGGLLKHDGSFVGITTGGGPCDSAVYRLDKKGTYTVLGGVCGLAEFVTLVQDTEGNLYGTTRYNRGLNCQNVNCGTIFKFDSSGNNTYLYEFTGGLDGKLPDTGLARDQQGNLYGTTTGGGAYGYGTIFKMDPTGTLTTLHSFSGGKDGATPFGVLIRSKNGSLYGTAAYGGSAGKGTVFRLNQDGKFVVLHSFQGEDGQNPFAGVIRDINGNLFGTTVLGGVYGAGTVFEISP